MLYNFSSWFMLFFIYSVIGYIVEVISTSLRNKKFCPSRGFLIGPYLPVFGFGCLFITIFLSKYSNDYVIIFTTGMVLCCIVEYFTSYLLERIFGLRWWDYSDRKFNINGRINLTTGIKFGVGSIVLLKIINPYIYSFSGNISENVYITISMFLILIMFTDTVISSFIISKLKIDTIKYFKKDATDEIKSKVGESIKKYNLFYSRVFHAFPNLPLYNKKFERIKKLIRIKK